MELVSGKEKGIREVQVKQKTQKHKKWPIWRKLSCLVNNNFFNVNTNAYRCFEESGYGLYWLGNKSSVIL